MSKIVLINSLYPPYHRGGAEIIVEKQAKQLSQEGHEVIVISTHPGKKKNPSQKRVEIRDGITIHRLPSYNFCSFYEYSQKSLFLRLVWLGVDLLNILAVRKVKTIIQSLKPGKVIVHNTRGLSYFVVKIIQRLGIDHVLTLHDIQLIYPSGLLIKGEEKKFINTFFLRKWYEAYNKIIFGSPDEVVAPSKWLLKLYASHGFFRKSKLHLSRPFEEYIGSVVTKDIQLPLKLLYVGQIEKHKGINFLIQTLLRADIDFVLDVIGIGSELDELKKQIQSDKRFVFHGWIKQEDLNKYYQEADITIVPSLTYENAPTVIYESLRNNTPVIASEIGGIPEIVTQANGWLFEAGNEGTLINLLQEIIKNPAITSRGNKP